MRKEIIMVVIGTIGSFFTSIFGGWNEAMTTLLIFMGIDYLTGFTVAAVFKKSNKTESGALESKAGFIGLLRKAAVLLLVLIACRLDLILGTAYIKDCVIIAFIVNETLSIVENVGIMGVPIPNIVSNAIELLKKKEEKQ